jgi:hypothetical protein
VLEQFGWRNYLNYLNQLLKVAVTEGYESVIVAVSELSLSLQDVNNKDANK